VNQLLAVVAAAAVSGLIVLPAAAQAPAAPQSSASSLRNYPAIVRSNPDPRLIEKLVAARDFRSTANPLEEREAAAIAAAAGAPCKVTEAGVVSRSAGLAYEVACDKDFGYIVSRSADNTYAAYDCLAVEATAKAVTTGREPARCRLRSNIAHKTDGLQALAVKAKLSNCAVADGQFRGVGGSPRIARYAITCKDKTSYLLDAPAPRYTAALTTPVAR